MYINVGWNWLMHDNFDRAYYEASFHPIKNCYNTCSESLANMVDNLTEERRNEFIEWMTKNAREQLEKIYEFTKFDKEE